MKGEIASLKKVFLIHKECQDKRSPLPSFPFHPSWTSPSGKYPVHARGSAALAEVTEAAGRRYLSEGIVTFPGFLLPEAVDLAVADIEMDTDKAWQGLVQKCGLSSLEQLVLLFEVTHILSSNV